jgi:lipoprotein-anchoring transpeptidase ErfK/SrfK
MRPALHRHAVTAALAATFLSGAAAVAEPLAMTEPHLYPDSVFRRVLREPATAPQASPSRQEPSAALPAHLRRQVVAYDGAEAPGTIVIDTPNTHLYLVLGNGRALRYGIGVGREGFTWSGVQRIDRKQEWPDWHPPAEMIARQPYLPRFMAGGPGNPLGARAMYLAGTLYRIHGTGDPASIGRHVSSGCIRMLNEDAIDLYDRTPLGTRVVVLADDGRRAAARADAARAAPAVAEPPRRPATLPSPYRSPRPVATLPSDRRSSLYYGSSASMLY